MMTRWTLCVMLMAVISPGCRDAVEAPDWLDNYAPDAPAVTEADASTGGSTDAVVASDSVGDDDTSSALDDAVVAPDVVEEEEDGESTLPDGEGGDLCTGVVCDGDAAECQTSACNPETGECELTVKEGWCFYTADERCVQEGVFEADNPCMGCFPDVWTSEPAEAPDGLACEDVGGLCVVASCYLGVCLIEETVDCDDGDPCTEDACVASTGGCVHTLLGNDELEFCDGLDNNCDGQVDEGFESYCKVSGEALCVSVGEGHASHPCQVCSEATEGASWALAEDGESCEGSPCLQNETCLGGQCVGTQVVDCDDGNPCTLDSCDESAGCVNDEEAVTGQACTVDVEDIFCGDPDTKCCASLEGGCIVGECLPSASWSCDLPVLSCQSASCGGGIDECGVVVHEGFCVIDDACIEGGAPNPTNPCQVCDPSVSQDDWSSIANGSECMSGNLCLTGETCSEGVCSDGAEVNCDDGLLCTEDSCEPDTGCTFDPQHDACLGTECSEGVCSPETGCFQQPIEAKAGANCDDGNACTATSICTAGVCTGGMTTQCDDGFDCTTDACDPETGDCEVTIIEGYCFYDEIECAPAGQPSLLTECLACHPEVSQTQPTSVMDGALCDDSDLCSETSTCQSGVCVLATETDCTDEYECTVDTCDPNVGCVNEADSSLCPDDDVACRLPNCWGNSGVGCSFILDHDLCDDVDACTDDLCVTEGCDNTSNVDCDDENDCTVDSCSAADGICANVANDADCDDSLGCTSDSCDVLAGGCTNVLIEGCVIDGQCVSALAESPSDSCLRCLPAESTNEWSSAEGLSCGAVVPFGSSSCGESGCEFACDDGYADCDGDLSNGCEAMVSEDPNRCGSCEIACPGAIPWCVNGSCQPSCSETECGTLCVDVTSHAEHCGGCDMPCSSSQPSHIGACVDSSCTESPCPEGLWDLDGVVANGCEYACTSQGEEACGGGDEDCDGEVDEGFFLASDPDHCGGCDQACAHETVSEWSCVESTCYINDCGPGQSDEDGVAENGCEDSVTVAGEFWVDPWAAMGDMDGSQGKPFVSLQDALSAAQDGYVIHLLEGSHAGGVFTLLNNLTLRGAGVGKTLIVTGAGETGILIAGSGVAIRDITFKGGAIAAHLAGADSAPLEGVQLTNVMIEDIVAAESAADTAGEPAYGLRAEHVNDLQLLNVTVTNVTGEVGGSKVVGLLGGAAYGVWLNQTSRARLFDVYITEVFGGAGGASNHMDNNGGVGGAATGLKVIGAIDLESKGLRVTTLLGGMGGYGFKWGDGGQGGAGIGLHVMASQEVVVTGAKLTGIDGHRGGDTFDEGSTGAGGAAIGAWFEGTSAVNFESSHISDLEAGASPAALYNTDSNEKVGGVATGVAVTDGANITLGGLEVSDLLCGRSATAGSWEWWQSYPPESVKDSDGNHICAQGVWIGDSTGVLIQSALVYRLRNNTQSTLGTTPLRGIAVDGSEYVTVQHATIYDLLDANNQEATWHVGVYGGAEQQGSLSVLNSIMSTVDGSCIANKSDNSGFLSVAYSLFHDCPSDADGEMLVNTSVNQCFPADPLFVAPEQGDFRLQTGSPAVDTGKASTNVCQEPEPNGCYPNLGAFGGTGDATGSASGVHCPCEAEVVCPEAQTCSDGDPCTDDVCAGGACVGTDNGSCP